MSYDAFHTNGASHSAHAAFDEVELELLRLALAEPHRGASDEEVEAIAAAALDGWSDEEIAAFWSALDLARQEISVDPAGALSGAATGAGVGTVAGPWGTAIGAGLGALMGAFGGNLTSPPQQPQQRPKPKPKRAPAKKGVKRKAAKRTPAPPRRVVARPVAGAPAVPPQPQPATPPFGAIAPAPPPSPGTAPISPMALAALATMGTRGAQGTPGEPIVPPAPGEPGEEPVLAGEPANPTGSATAALVQVLQDPQTVGALVSSLLGAFGAGDVAVGPRGVRVPRAAFLDAIAVLADRAAECAARIDAADPTAWLRDGSGGFCADPASRDARADTLLALLREPFDEPAELEGSAYAANGHDGGGAIGWLQRAGAFDWARANAPLHATWTGAWS